MTSPQHIQQLNFMNILCCCQLESNISYESIASDHMIGYIYSGNLYLRNNHKSQILNSGRTFFIKKNHELQLTGKTDKNGNKFCGLFLILNQKFLKNFYRTHQLSFPSKLNTGNRDNYLQLPSHPFLNNFFKSLIGYFGSGEYPSRELMNTKLDEVTWILLQTSPEVQKSLFDFRKEWKINLEEFMRKNYCSHLSLEEFAHYSGRSLASFKRDFKAIFNDSPSRWIIKKRLQRAFYEIEEKGEKPSEIYLKVGFKNLSHFSRTFKQEFGINPSQLAKEASQNFLCDREKINER